MVVFSQVLDAVDNGDGQGGKGVGGKRNHGDFVMLYRLTSINKYKHHCGDN